jgi:hypothetical protein
MWSDGCGRRKFRGRNGSWSPVGCTGLHSLFYFLTFDARIGKEESARISGEVERNRRLGG